MATENAVSALGKVLEGHSGALAPPDAARAWGVWAASLPLVEDKVEARAVHAQLVHLLEAFRRQVLALAVSPPYSHHPPPGTEARGVRTQPTPGACIGHFVAHLPGHTVLAARAMQACS